MNIDKIATTRYTTKSYDPHKRIGAAQLEQIQTLLRNTPSSINSQPWHFIIAGSDEGKARVAKATTGPYSANDAKVRNCSHVVVLCAGTDLTDAHMAQVLDQEEKDGRFKNPEAKAGTLKGRMFYVNLHRDLGDTPHWMEKQVYIALGTLLLGAGALEIDATPIEGFDRDVLDREFGLRERGLSSVVLVALGYRNADDFNATLPKSRLPADEIFTFV